METAEKVIINFIRVNAPPARYTEGFVRDDGTRLETFSIIPPEYRAAWSVRWHKMGMLSAGQVLYSVRKRHFYHQHFTILEYRDAEDQLLGYYCDVAAPLEKHGEEYTLRDLMLDLWVGADGRVMEFDRDEFDAAAAGGLLAPADQAKAITALAWMKTSAQAGTFPGAYL